MDDSSGENGLWDMERGKLSDEDILELNRNLPLIYLCFPQRWPPLA